MVLRKSVPVESDKQKSWDDLPYMMSQSRPIPDTGSSSPAMSTSNLTQSSTISFTSPDHDQQSPSMVTYSDIQNPWTEQLIERPETGDHPPSLRAGVSQLSLDEGKRTGGTPPPPASRGETQRRDLQDAAGLRQHAVIFGATAATDIYPLSLHYPLAFPSQV